MLKNTKNLISLFFLTILIAGGSLIAGAISNNSIPAPTGHTLEDIYNLVHNNSTTTSSHSLSPNSDITHSVSDIYVELANLIDPANLASTSVTYLGVTGGDTLPTDVISTFSSSTKTANSFTLSDIANLIANRTDNTSRITTPDHSFTPTSGPIYSGPTLESIYSSLTTLITASNIATGTAYLGVMGSYEVETYYDLIVSGELSPDVTGGYNESGVYNNYMSYEKVGGGYSVWWNDVGGHYMITSTLGGYHYLDPNWVKVDNSPTVAGEYSDNPTGMPPSTGIATVVLNTEWIPPLSARTLYFKDTKNTPNYGWNSVENWWTACDGSGNVSGAAGGLPVDGDTVYIINRLSSSPTIPITAAHIYVNDDSTGDNSDDPTGNTGGWHLVFLDHVTGDVTVSHATRFSGVVIGNIELNDSANSGAVVSGNAVLNDDSFINTNFGATIQGNAEFRDNSYNQGNIGGNADVYFPSPKPIGGTVVGTLTYHNYPAGKIVILGPGANPDIAGDYFEDGEYNGYMSYKNNNNNNYYISWVNDTWFISSYAGDVSDNFYYNFNETGSIDGQYIYYQGSYENDQYVGTTVTVSNP